MNHIHIYIYILHTLENYNLGLIEKQKVVKKIGQMGSKKKERKKMVLIRLNLQKGKTLNYIFTQG